MAGGPGHSRGGTGSSGSDSRLAIEGDRAQTTIDFMIGAGVFLLVVGFVLGTIPGMIDPFSDSQETTLVADRLATQITEGMIAEPDQPTVLNQTCMDAFFGVGSASGNNCPVSFDETTTDLPDRLGVNDRHSINVTIERDIDDDARFEILSSDGTGVGTAGTRLAIGATPPDTGSVVVASRTAFVDEKDVRVIVRVW